MTGSEAHMLLATQISVSASWATCQAATAKARATIRARTHPQGGADVCSNVEGMPNFFFPKTTQRFIPEMGRTEIVPRSQRGTWWRTRMS